MSLADLREEYRATAFNESDLELDPIRQFEKWFDRARTAGANEPNAMTLATADSKGRPSARIVLLKELTPEGFGFFTNYDSRKGRELVGNPHAALVFFWPELARQVRVTGTVVKTSREEAGAYFQSRPRGAQIGAWASAQSSTIPSRDFLNERVLQLEEKYAAGSVPLPPTWGGFRLHPETVEFWQGRPNRLHDRLRYSKAADGAWIVERLAP